MMRTFVDEVRYNATGNAVTLVKHRDVQESPTCEAELAAVH